MLAPRSRWLRCRSGEQRRRRWRGLVSAMQFAVGMKVDGKSDHAVVDAEDAPIAALKARCSGPTRKSVCAPREQTGKCTAPGAFAQEGAVRKVTSATELGNKA